MAPSITPTHGRRNVVFFVFVIAQILAGLLCVIGVILEREFLRFVLFGIPFSQVTLLATWNALGDGRLGLRPIGSILCLIVVWLVGFGLPTVAGQFPTHIAAPAGIAMFVQWILVQVPLWIVRLTFGWHMGVIDQQNEASGPRDLQFGIKHLIIWTTFVAIVLGLAKLLVGKGSVDSHAAVVFFGPLLIFNSLVAWPTLLGSLTYRWMPAALLAALAFTVAVTIAEPFVFQAILGEMVPNIFWWLNGTQFFWIAGSMLILRRFGFRLVRPRRVDK